MSSHSNHGLTVTPHLGDGAVLLAFDLPKSLSKNLAGFAIFCTTPDKGPYPSNEYWLRNMLNFEDALTKEGQARPTQSRYAPFQSFHWMHFPGAGPGRYKYRVHAAYFKPSGGVGLGHQRTVKVDLRDKAFPKLEIGFTRGYISSQAYEDRFHNKGIAPKKKSITFNTKAYQPQYEWLGAHARKMVFQFLGDCRKDASLSVDVFAYDFDEPDVIRALAKLGPRVRVYLDDSTQKDSNGKRKGHGASSSMESKAAGKLEAAGCQVERGHFGRFAHDKVMIQKKNGQAIRVLTGSANFSLRGLYVQANSILVFTSPKVAQRYEEAFEQAFTAARKFRSSPIAAKWFKPSGPGLPGVGVSFAPHHTAFTLDEVDQEIRKAKSSVFFAVMQMSGSGPVMPDLEKLSDRDGVLSLGTIQNRGQLKLFKPGIDDNAAVTSFGYLSKNVPEPFQKEWSGGRGQVIHHKFVVKDFNGRWPRVFCGSSNLAEGGEKSNGDNLLEISDPEVATAYAVEAIRLYDHYRFRNRQGKSTSKKPFILDPTDAWAKSYYDPNDIHCLERKRLAKK
jgi:hypothetical protein